MLSKEKFRKYVKNYLKFSDLLDSLDTYYIKLWELDSVGWFLTSYVELLDKLMEPDLPEDRTYNSELEDFLCNQTISQELSDEELDKAIDDLYSRIRYPEFYSVEEDDAEDNIPETCYVDFENIFGFSLEDLDEILKIRR